MDQQQVKPEAEKKLKNCTLMPSFDWVQFWSQESNGTFSPEYYFTKVKIFLKLHP